MKRQKKFTHLEYVQAMYFIQAYTNPNNMPSINRTAIEKL